MDGMQAAIVMNKAGRVYVLLVHAAAVAAATGSKERAVCTGTGTGARAEQFSHSAPDLQDLKCALWTGSRSEMMQTKGCRKGTRHRLK